MTEYTSLVHCDHYVVYVFRKGGIMLKLAYYVLRLYMKEPEIKNNVLSSPSIFFSSSGFGRCVLDERSFIEHGSDNIVLIANSLVNLEILDTLQDRTF